MILKICLVSPFRYSVRCDFLKLIVIVNMFGYALIRLHILLMHMNMDDEELPSPVNSDIVKRYYA